jgi:glycosyltransferase involved in cell wall biosynthesis
MSQHVASLNLLMAGDGPERSKLERMVRESGSNSIRLLGHLDDDGVRAVFAASDLQIFPSVREPYGLVVLESMAAGVPVVTTRLVGSAEDLVIPGVTGVLAEPDDVEAMANGGIEYFTQPDTAANMRAAAVAVARRHTLQVEAERFVNAVVRFSQLQAPGCIRATLPKALHNAGRPSLVYVTSQLAPYRLPFLRHLGNSGLDVSVVEANADSGSEQQGVEDTKSPVVHRLHAKTPWRGDVIRKCNDLHPDVVLIEHGARHGFTWSLLLSRAIGAKRVLWTHGIENKERFKGTMTLASWGRWCQLRMADAILCYDVESAKVVAARIPGVPTGAAPNSTDGRAFAEAAREWPAARRRELKSEMGLDLDYYIAAVGRMVRGKDLGRLPRILALVRRECPTVGMVLVGDGPERVRLERVFVGSDFRVGRDVKFLGNISAPAELAKVLRMVDVIVNPGYIGLVAVDAMFAGIPVVLALPTKSGPFHSPEWTCLRDSVGGLFAAEDTDEALARRLIEYLNEPDHERSSRERECTEFAESFLGIGLMADGCVALLAKAGIRLQDRAP